jgi:hypothetical protein
MFSCNNFKSKSINGTFVKQKDCSLFFSNELVFKDDKLIIDLFTKMAFDYEIKGNNIYVKSTQFPIVIEIVDSNTLKYEDCIFKKLE